MWNRNSVCELPEINSRSFTNQNKGSKETIMENIRDSEHHIGGWRCISSIHNPQMQNNSGLSFCASCTCTPQCTGSFALWGACPAPANLILNPPLKQGSESIFMSLSGLAFLLHHRGLHAASVHILGLEAYPLTYLVTFLGDLLVFKDRH